MKVIRLAIVLAAVAGPVAAQQQPMHHQPAAMAMMHGDMMPGMDSMMAPMMRAMAYAPQHLLREKTSLHLTADQVTLLTQLADSAKATHDAAAQQAQMHLGEMEQALHAAAPDTAAVKAHFDAAHRYMSDAMWAMLRSAALARADLTDEQRTQVDAMARHGNTMHHGAMGSHGAAGH